MKYRVFSIIGLCLAVTACSDDNSIASVNGQAIDQQQFSDYLELKGQSNLSEQQKISRLKEYVERYGLVEAIKQQDLLEKEKLAVELQEFEKQMYISRYFDKYLAEVVDENAIQNYYATHKSEFQSNKAKVAHILIRLRKEMSEEEVRAKLTQAHEIHSKLKTGESFQSLALAYSEDKNSSTKSGDLGWLKEGAISPVFSKAAFALQKGAVSEPVRTAFGFHIIKLEEGPSLVTTPFEKVKGDIRYQLRNKAKAAELERLMKTINVKINQ